MASALSLRSLPDVTAIAAGLIAVAGPATAQSDIEVVARWAATHSVPVRTVEMAGSTADLAPLAAMVGDARVIAFGEPTHGAHEPLAFRNRLFRYLAEELGFTAIVLETSLTESRRIHDYVLGGPGEVGDVVRESMSWGFGGYQDNVDLVQWIRAYNADPSHTRKVHVYCRTSPSRRRANPGALRWITLWRTWKSPTPRRARRCGRGCSRTWTASRTTV
jgi:erythromycin esterase